MPSGVVPHNVVGDFRTNGPEPAFSLLSARHHWNVASGEYEAPTCLPRRNDLALLRPEEPFLFSHTMLKLIPSDNLERKETHRVIACKRSERRWSEHRSKIEADCRKHTGFVHRQRGLALHHQGDCRDQGQNGER